MARIKRRAGGHQPYHRRTSWTRFHLPRDQDWPTWSTSYQDPHLGPLSDARGCELVWLGRRVEDPEQAALVVLWHTADDLRNFQHSPAGAAFLRDLPEQGVQAFLVSGALLRGVSLDDPPPSPPPPPAPSRFLAFQWWTPGDLEKNLEGRITFTALEVSSTTVPAVGSWSRALHDVFQRFMPKGCEDLLAVWKVFPLVQCWRSLAKVVTEDAPALTDNLSQIGQQAATTQNSGGREVWCEFRRWNGYMRATPEREEASAQSPLARESWAQAIARVNPSVIAWEQERWDMQLAARYKEEEEEEEEEGGEEEEEEEGEEKEA